MYKKFCFVFAAVAGCVFFVAAAVNAVVDPYDVWRLYRQPGFNQWSVKAEEQDRLVKPIDFMGRKPQAVFLGNSQVDWAIEPETYKNLTGREAYNFALQGASVYEMRRLLEHAIALDDELREVYVCIGFEMFVNLSDGKPMMPTKDAFDERQIGLPFMDGSNFAKTTLSFQALKDSAVTVMTNRRQPTEETFFTPGGRWREISIEHFISGLQWHFSVAPRVYDAYIGMSLYEESFSELEEIVSLCNQHGLALTVYTLPMHARSMELRKNVQGLYAEWLRRVTRIVPLMDFEAYNDITMAAYGEGVVTETTCEYFWDSHHPKRHVGDMVIARLLGRNNDMPGFGVVVTAENTDEVLERLRQGRLRWEVMHPDSVEEVLYYTAFLPEPPSLLRDKELQPGSLAGLQTGIGSKPFAPKLTENDRLEARGTRFTGLHSPRLFAVLAKDGEKYYAMAEPARNPAAAEFMGNKEFAEDEFGFRIGVPLRGLLPGQYRLTLVE